MYKLLFAALLAAGCGAAAPDQQDTGVDDVYWGPPANAPGVSGWLGGEREALCASDPENEACSDLGSLEQPWVSAEYYGWDGTDLTPCYSPGSTANDCLVPRYKQMKYTIDTSNCSNNTVPIIQLTDILSSFEEGMKVWNAAGAGVTINKVSGNQSMLVTCVDLPGNPEGLGGISGATHTQINNLPVGPHGKDEKTAQQISTSFIQLDVQRIYDFWVGCHSVQDEALLKKHAKFVGAHETGHGFGFAHFTSGLMKNGATCAEHEATIDLSKLGPALGTYDGSATAPSVVDRGLQAYGPP